MSYSVRSGYRFPYNFTRSYLRWWYWWNMLKHWYQRMRYGVSFADQWSLDSYFTRVLTRALPHYQHRNGEAHLLYMLDEDDKRHWAFLHGDGAEIWNDDIQQEALDRWDAMIDEILEGLAVDESDDLEYIHSTEGQAKIERAWLLFAENVRDLWD